MCRSTENKARAPANLIQYRIDFQSR